MHQSIIRDKNHFIKLTGRYRWEDSWLLISGPAFDHLESFRLSQLRIPNYIVSRHFESDCSPLEYSPDFNTYWERKIIDYHGYGKKQLQIGNMDEAWDLHLRIDKYDYASFNPMEFVLIKKDSIIAWVCEGGILPAHIANVKWDKNLQDLLELKYHRRTDDDNTFI